MNYANENATMHACLHEWVHALLKSRTLGVHRQVDIRWQGPQVFESKMYKMPYGAFIVIEKPTTGSPGYSLLRKLIWDGQH